MMVVAMLGDVPTTEQTIVYITVQLFTPVIANIAIKQPFTFTFNVTIVDERELFLKLLIPFDFQSCCCICTHAYFTADFTLIPNNLRYSVTSSGK